MGLFAFIFIIFSVIPSQAHLKMVGAPNNNYFQRATCHLVNKAKGSNLTGVLIAPDLVATAAHGVTENATFGIYFSNGVSCKSTKVIIPRIFSENRSKYDLAFIKLKTPVQNITPLSFKNEIILEKNKPLLVNTLIPTWYQKKPRSFFLYERDILEDRDDLQKHRSLLMGSIFFNPDGQSRPSLNDGESKLRSYKAYKNWMENGEGAYALGLPGSSGSPVMINENGDYFLFGLITAYSFLNGFEQLYKKDLTRVSKNDLYGKIQTIFALFYKKDQGFISATEERYILNNDLFDSLAALNPSS